MKHLQLYEYYMPQFRHKDELKDFRRRYEEVMKGDKGNISQELNMLIDEISEKFPLFYELVQVMQDITDGGAMKDLDELAELALDITRGIDGNV